MTDNYLPGAMVLGHSLKDGGTGKQLIALITPETISMSAIDELKVCLRPFFNTFLTIYRKSMIKSYQLHRSGMLRQEICT